MHRENLFERTDVLKPLFSSFFQHKKKVRALENFAEAEVVTYTNELSLIKSCLENRFLSKKGSDFLEELLEENRVNYLDWSHRTRWLKSQIQARKRERAELPKIQQAFFDFARPQPQVPLSLFRRRSFRQAVGA